MEYVNWAEVDDNVIVTSLPFAVTGSFPRFSTRTVTGIVATAAFEATPERNIVPEKVSIPLEDRPVLVSFRTKLMFASVSPRAIVSTVASAST
jgi:hypothetical protein